MIDCPPHQKENFLAGELSGKDSSASVQEQEKGQAKAMERLLTTALDSFYCEGG